MNYRDIINAHIEKGADITVVSKVFDYDRDLTKMGVMETDGSGRIVEFEEKPIDPQSKEANLGIYVIERTLLMSLLEETVPEGSWLFRPIPIWHWSLYIRFLLNYGFHHFRKR